MKPKNPKRRPSDLVLACTPTFIVAADAGDDGKPRLPRVSMIAYTGGPMRVYAWSDPVVIDFAGLKIPASVPLRFGHDPRELVGHSEEAEIANGKLTIEGVISFETTRARSIVTSAQNGFPWQASVGVQPIETEFVPAGKTTEVNGKQVSGPIDIVRKGQLKEVSFVDLGADSKTSATIAAKERGQGAEAMDEDDQVVDPDATPTATPAPKPKPAAPPVAAAGDTINDVVSEARRETERRDRITSMVKAALKVPGADIDALEEIGKQAINGNWDVQRTELQLMRATRVHAPAGHVSSGGPPSDAVLAASVLLACGMKSEKLAKDMDFGDRVVEAAWKRRNMGLHELIATSLRANGVHVEGGGENLFRAMVQHGIRAGFSTVNLPGILGTVGNKLLLDSFTAVESTFEDLADIADFNNFLAYTSYRLSATGEFAKVGADGEIKHGALSEDSYTNQLDTRGQMLMLTRRDIINDDLNALVQLYKILGRKAKIALEEAVYDAFMEASDVFFTSGRGNLQASSALSITTLAAAEALMMGQTDADSKPIYAMPAKLVVPPALKFLAEQIYTSTQLGSGSSGSPTDNPFRGRFKVVSSPFLSLSGLAGSSATTWYLFADPAMLPALQVAFLRGQRAPIVETADAVFNTLGMGMRCYFDFGVGQVDYRGAVKSTA